jgi:hypothetical protein
MTTEQPIPLDKMAGVYIKIRDKIAEITKAYDNEVETLKAQQAEVAGVMKDILKEMGMRSVNTVAGTVILTEKTRYFPTDWSQFKEFIKENDLIDLMEKRIAQQNMQDFLTEHPDQVPPGLNAESEYTITVRRPNQN